MMDDIQVVLFKLNEIACGADSSQVQEIVKHQEVSRVPNMPRFIEGIINLRGKVVPIVNLNRRFDLGETPITKKTKIIITRINDSYIGYIVNEVSEITKFKSDNLELPSEVLRKINNTYIKCVGIKEEKIIIILDLSAILTDSELDMIHKDTMVTV
ncbi:MAG TPA: chemotaxis protein CheW [Pseudobacteroides sp.]|uniref:chemotaxis protein CheW n=1 Tax=Pseudobacteroides sp. TaxID=1968840 RepID=UPI002F935D6F